MTDDEARQAARKAISRMGSGPMTIDVDEDARVIHLTDPDATGVAVQAWVYVMDVESDRG